jgi:hypothetical protein
MLNKFKEVVMDPVKVGIKPYDFKIKNIKDYMKFLPETDDEFHLRMSIHFINYRCRYDERVNFIDFTTELEFDE